MLSLKIEKGEIVVSKITKDHYVIDDIRGKNVELTSLRTNFSSYYNKFSFSKNNLILSFKNVTYEDFIGFRFLVESDEEYFKIEKYFKLLKKDFIMTSAVYFYPAILEIKKNLGELHSFNGGEYIKASYFIESLNTKKATVSTSKTHKKIDWKAFFKEEK